MTRPYNRTQRHVESTKKRIIRQSNWQRRLQARLLREQGAYFYEIGKAMGISKQQAHQYYTKSLAYTIEQMKEYIDNSTS